MGGRNPLLVNLRDPLTSNASRGATTDVVHAHFMSVDRW